MLTDVKCPKCNKIYEDKIIFDEEKDIVICPVCGTKCEIVKSYNSSFRLKYDNKKDVCAWSNENYASSQYYKEYDKQAKHNIFTMPTTKKT